MERFKASIVIIANIIVILASAWIISYAFFYQVKMSGGSMQPSIVNDEDLIVNRFAFKVFGIKRYDCILFLDYNGKQSIKRVIDVIEGSAMEALPYMKSVIEKKQNEFNSVNEAISYMASTQIRNLESCRVSIPPLLKQIKNAKGKKVFTWKTDLFKTEKFWEDWYKDLSKQFLPKALILTDTNELDTPLTVGHMQGKFKLVVIKGTGHFVMEDDPAAVMEKINIFCQVFRLPRLVEDIKLIKSELGDQVKVVKYSE